MLAYLHLFYADYFAEQGDPRNILNEAKKRIKDNALKQLEDKEQTSRMVEEAFEKKFNLTEDDFQSIKIDFLNEENQAFKTMNSLGTDFDNAISRMKKALEKTENAIELRKERDYCITIIDKILKEGADSAVLGEGAYQQLNDGLKRLQKIDPDKGKTKKEKDEIINVIKDVENNVSGYLLEFIMIYAFLAANKTGLSEMQDMNMINIGSKTLSEEVRRTFKDNSNMKRMIDEINKALKANNGKQAKVDNLAAIDMSEGNGTASTELTWVGFQAKNYREINAVHVASKTLQALNLFSYYTKEPMVVNIAGSLGSNISKETRGKIEPAFSRHEKEIEITQRELDQMWFEIKNYMKLSFAADAIAGSVRTFGANKVNFTGNVHYYVIRKKSGLKIDTNGEKRTAYGEVRVIGVSRILKKIREALKNEETNLLGIKMETSSSKTNNRSKYWNINVDSFQEEKSDVSDEKYIRSSQAYSKVLKAIQDTKISIALNFSSFFR